MSPMHFPSTPRFRSSRPGDSQIIRVRVSETICGNTRTHSARRSSDARTSAMNRARSPVDTPGDLARFIAEVRASLDRLAEWVRVFPQMVSETLTRMIWESPGLLDRKRGVEGKCMGDIRGRYVTGVQTCALPLSVPPGGRAMPGPRR